MPGPLLTVTISETLKSGIKAGPIVVSGHATAELLLVSGLVMGLAPFFKLSPVTAAISLAGGSMLIWMGISMASSFKNISIPKPTDIKGSGTKRSFLSGILASVSNPYWSIWWATVGTGYLMEAYSIGMIGVAAFFTGHILADYAWYSAISIGLRKGVSLMSQRAYQWLIFSCGIVLLGFGLWFFTSGIGSILRTTNP